MGFTEFQQRAYGSLVLRQFGDPRRATTGRYILLTMQLGPLAGQGADK